MIRYLEPKDCRMKSYFYDPAKGVSLTQSSLEDIC